MPSRPLRPCTRPGCSELVHKGRCLPHQATQRKQEDSTRPSYRERGYGTAWRKARAGFLREHPLCEYCLAQGRTTPANTVDHYVPHRGDQTLFWQTSNWRATCASCHSIKTNRQDGGYGNRSQRPLPTSPVA